MLRRTRDAETGTELFQLGTTRRCPPCLPMTEAWGVKRGSANVARWDDEDDALLVEWEGGWDGGSDEVGLDSTKGGMEGFPGKVYGFWGGGVLEGVGVLDGNDDLGRVLEWR